MIPGNTNNKTEINALCTTIEKMLNHQMSTPKDFDYLSQQIFSKLKVLLSPTTLKRIWGYLNEGNHPRESTLSILSQFAGYRDWESFTSRNTDKVSSQSNLILSRRLSSHSLREGQQVLLSWLPDRRCRIEYLGCCRFKVLESYNCKLNTGDSFSCSTFIENEPLYIDKLNHGIYEGIAYVAGKREGIRFEILEESVTPTGRSSGEVFIK